MKITKLTTYPVPPRWLFLKIETDEGITGWGEPDLEGRAATVAAAVGELSDYLVGKDPRRIEDHWQVLYRGGFYRGGPVLMSAIAGIDQALWDIKQLAAASTPIALGERLYSRWDFKAILASGAVDVIQPDPSHAGGISETRRIAAMAEAYDTAVALHCPLGPIALAACLQLDACTNNAFIQEQSLGIHYNVANDLLDYITEPGTFAYSAGYVTIPTGPGLGIDVNEDYVSERALEGHRWRNPVWRHADGSVAEW